MWLLGRTGELAWGVDEELSFLKATWSLSCGEQRTCLGCPSLCSCWLLSWFRWYRGKMQVLDDDMGSGQVENILKAMRR